MPPAFRARKNLQTGLWVLLLVAIGALSVAARCYNVRETFIAGRIYYVDGDCYARMTRARIILEHPGTIIHHHDFENFPDGVRSHTTAPFDYSIVLLKWVLDLTHLFPAEQTLDVAGAFISPLIGLLTCLYLGWWVRWGLTLGPDRKPPRLAAAVPLFFAVSPILVHGTVLGRPDHQAPVILLLAISLTAELNLLSDVRRPRAWAAAAGVAWGMALWISLFEPLLLLLGTLAVAALVNPRSLARRERLWEAVPLAVLLGLMLLIEGSPIPHLDPEVSEYFRKWSTTVAELNSMDLKGMLLYQWLGFGCLAAPVLLVLAARTDRRAWAVLILLLAMFATSYFHLRWGYFLGLAYAISMPWQLDLIRWRWVGWTLLVLTWYPLAQSWDLSLFPDEEGQRLLAEKQRERVLLRRVANSMRDEENSVLPFLAPWWLSPALAYWSGQPGVTGSSHEGLPGIVDSARFYLAEDPRKAAAILEKRRIAFVVVDEPSRTIDTALPLLNEPPPAKPLGKTIYEAPHSAPRFLSLHYANAYYKVFSVDTTRAEP